MCEEVHERATSWLGEETERPQVLDHSPSLAGGSGGDLVAGEAHEPQVEDVAL
jgi:hypothetical protein